MLENTSPNAIEIEIAKNQKKCNTASVSLFLAIALTVVNVVFAFLNSYSYFYFSLYVPYFIIDFGMLLTGLYPDDFYVGELAELVVFEESVVGAFVIFTIIILALYCVVAVFTRKNNPGWTVAGLVFLSLDTLWLLLAIDFSVDSLISIAFHVWLIVELAIAINASKKIKLAKQEMISAEVYQKTAVDSFDGLMHASGEDVFFEDSQVIRSNNNDD